MNFRSWAEHFSFALKLKNSQLFSMETVEVNWPEISHLMEVYYVLYLHILHFYFCGAELWQVTCQSCHSEPSRKLSISWAYGLWSVTSASQSDLSTMSHELFHVQNISHVLLQNHWSMFYCKPLASLIEHSCKVANVIAE